MLMKLAIEKTDREAAVSFLMLIFRWLMWYAKVRIWKRSEPIYERLD